MKRQLPATEKAQVLSRKELMLVDGGKLSECKEFCFYDPWGPGAGCLPGKACVLAPCNDDDGVQAICI